MAATRISFLVLALLLALAEAGIVLEKNAYWRNPGHTALVSPELLADRFGALAPAAPGSRPRLLLLGDSVSAGSALREHGVPQWRAKTLAAQLRLQPQWAGWDVVDFSADGLNPADLAALERSTEALSPTALVLELNYRMFSTEAGDSATAFSRPWLQAGAKPDGADGAPLDETLRRHWLLYRYAALARFLFWQPSPSETLGRWLNLLLPARTDEERAELLLDLKIRPYYQAPAMGPSHLGRLALAQMADRLRQRGIPTLVFLTPQNHERVDDFLDRGAWAANRTVLAGLFAPAPGGRLSYRDWADRPLEGAFLDHCHPDPAGTLGLARWITLALKP